MNLPNVQEKVKLMCEKSISLLHQEHQETNNLLISTLLMPLNESGNLQGSMRKSSMMTNTAIYILKIGLQCKLFAKFGKRKEVHLFLSNDLINLAAKKKKETIAKPRRTMLISNIEEIKDDYYNKNTYNKSLFAKSTGTFSKSKFI